MREILFRGKVLSTGGWIFGTPIKNKLGTYIVFEKNPHYCSQYGYMEISELALVDPETVGQYTGLTDYIDDKIFEGDICQDSLGNIFVVKWDKENARFLGYCKDNRIIYVGKEPKVDIIGNIHDNPELMEVDDGS